MEFNEEDYYSLHRILSYNAVWNFIIGARGLGKTFDAKRHVLRDSIKNGSQFIYLRRTDVEIRGGAKEKWMDDILFEFKNFEFRINGNTLEWRRAKDKGEKENNNEWHIGGYFLALSQSGGKKSIPYPNVRWIIFDEVFPDNLRFLSNEVTLFEEFYNTVDRTHDHTRVLLLSNAVSQANPYFSKFRIDINDQQKKKRQFQTYCDGFIGIEFADYAGFSAKVEQSRYGKFLRKYDPDYADYAISNKFLDDINGLVEPFNPKLGYMFTLETEDNGTFGIWSKIGDSISYFISRRVKKHAEYHYTLDYRKVNEHVIYVKKSDNVVANLLGAYRTGEVKFDTRQCKADFMQVVGTLIGK